MGENKQVTLNDKEFVLDKGAFWPGMLALLAFITIGAIWTEQTGNALTTILYSVADWGGWIFDLICVISILLTVVVIIHKYGDIVIGGKDAKPEFKTKNWLMITLCGGIGVGILFWAIGEPIYHFAQPPAAAGAEAFSRDAGIFAVSQAMWDWTIPQYCIYTLPGIAFGLAAYNLKLPLSFGPILHAIFGRPMPKLTTVLNAITLFTLGGAISSSCAGCILQAGAGVESITGIPQQWMVWLVIAAVIGGLFTVSCVMGMKKGLKALSTFTTISFFILLFYVFIFGDPVFISKIGIESVGEIFDNWCTKTTIANTMAPDDSWFADWTIQYWACFVVYGPVIGMFLCRMSKGRTVKQFLLVGVCAPTIFCWAWIATFGGMTVKLQSSGAVDIWESVNTYGMQKTVFNILEALPCGLLVCIFFTIVIFTSFSTLADPMISVLATVSVKDQEIDAEPPKVLKIIIGIVVAAVAYILVITGGASSIKGMWIVVGIPVLFILVLSYIGIFKIGKICYNLPNNCLESKDEFPAAIERQKQLDKSKEEIE